MRQTLAFRLSLCASAALLLAACTAPAPPKAEAKAEPDPKALRDASVARTRDQVKMLDDLYKTAVVLINEHYIEDRQSYSAASASKQIFAAMKEKGYHEVRLLGLTSKLMNEENKPADAFENAVSTKFLAGATSHEEIVSENGVDYLRYATPIPVVMDKCLICHPDYKGNKGFVGALAYKMKLVG